MPSPHMKIDYTFVIGQESSWILHLLFLLKIFQFQLEFDSLDGESCGISNSTGGQIASDNLSWFLSKPPTPAVCLSQHLLNCLLGQKLPLQLLSKIIECGFVLNDWDYTCVPKYLNVLRADWNKDRLSFGSKLCLSWHLWWVACNTFTKQPD